MRKAKTARSKPDEKPVATDTAPDLRFLTAAAARPAASGRAPRYSRFVRSMKLLLPASAALLLGALLLWPQLQAERNRFHISISNLDPRHPDRLRVLNARYQGVDNDRQPFSVTAESAHEIDPNSRIVALESPAADLATADGAWVIANAPEGTYNRDTSLLDLRGGVSVFHDKGYTFTSPTARLLLQEGRAEGDDPAFAHGPGGEILGKSGFVITDKGRRILFKGQSRLIIRPGVTTNVP